MAPIPIRIKTRECKVRWTHGKSTRCHWHRNQAIPVENALKDEERNDIETNIPQIHHQYLKLALPVSVSGEISLGCPL